MKKAVALRYDIAKENVPKVVGKGKGLMAERIIKIAKENELPIKKDEDLVELLTKIDIDKEIPNNLSNRVAQFQNIQFKGKILVAEDNFINQKLVKQILIRYGEVELANNGLEAFERYRSNKYDLIFMDIQMPVMDGVEATHEILNYEKEEKLPHTPIVALTANALKGDRERFIDDGLDDYIPKPIETNELLFILKKFLEQNFETKARAKRRARTEYSKYC